MYESADRTGFSDDTLWKSNFLWESCTTFGYAFWYPDFWLDGGKNYEWDIENKWSSCSLVACDQQTGIYFYKQTLTFVTDTKTTFGEGVSRGNKWHSRYEKI